MQTLCVGSRARLVSCEHMYVLHWAGRVSVQGGRQTQENVLSSRPVLENMVLNWSQSFPKMLVFIRKSIGNKTKHYPNIKPWTCLHTQNILGVTLPSENQVRREKADSERRGKDDCTVRLN